MNKPPRHVISVACLVRNERNEILLVKTPVRGWELPGGQVELNESLYDAAIRETKEESGIDIEIIKMCGIFQNLKNNICNILLMAGCAGGSLTTSDESTDVGFFPVQEALMKVTYGNFRQRIKLCLDVSSHPFVVIHE